VHHHDVNRNGFSGESMLVRTSCAEVQTASRQQGKRGKPDSSQPAYACQGSYRQTYLLTRCAQMCRNYYWDPPTAGVRWSHACLQAIRTLQCATTDPQSNDVDTLFRLQCQWPIGNALHIVHTCLHPLNAPSHRGCSPSIHADKGTIPMAYQHEPGIRA